MNTTVDIARAVPAFERFYEETGVAAIKDEAHYDRMCALLDNLMDAANGDESSSAMMLADIVGDLVHDYEAIHHPMPESSAAGALRFLMEEHGLRQSGLPEIGSQGVVSEILSGKREINPRQARTLARRFGVSAATFI
ncbi:MAG: transcriptional regulator [Candidatus Accumulibacter sp.]|jgi:HTH-type transcriptional regulator/antitoxin HigA|nr:transcriptional regulator [Accumulibacter sp.]